MLYRRGWVNIDNCWQLMFLPATLIARRLNVWRTPPAVCLWVIVDELATLAADKRQRMAGAYADVGQAKEKDRQGRAK